MSPGVAGESGQSFTLKGNYTNLSAFNSGAGASAGTPGDCWLLESDGSLMVYSIEDGWIDAGDIIGPAGPEGPIGLQGPKGDTGLTGPKGDTGADGMDGTDGTDAPTDRIYNGNFQAIIDATGTTTFDGNIVPSVSTYALGTETLPWKDIYVSAGSINIADNDMETDSVSIKNTDGYLVLSRGGLKVTDNTNQYEVFQLNPDGTLALKSNVTEGTTGAALEIIGSLNGTSIAPSNIGVLLHLTGLRNSPSRIYNDSYGTGVYSAYIGRHARGTSENPEGLIAGDIISRIGGNSFLSSGVFAPISNVRMDFVTKENQTNTARGNEIQFWTTANGSITPTRSFTLESTGLTFPDNTKQTTAAVAQVNSDWNATTGKAQILNKPSIPAAQVNADWNSVSGISQILNKPDLSSIMPTLTTYASTLSSTNLAYSGTPTSAQYIATGKMIYVNIDVNLATVTNFGQNGIQYFLTLPFTAAYNALLSGTCTIAGTVYEIAGKVTAGSNSVGLMYSVSNGANTPNTFESFTKQKPANMTTSTVFRVGGTFISQ